jgi:hypothetical protein
MNKMFEPRLTGLNDYHDYQNQKKSKSSRESCKSWFRQGLPKLEGGDEEPDGSADI